MLHKIMYILYVYCICISYFNHIFIILQYFISVQSDIFRWCCLLVSFSLNLIFHMEKEIQKCDENKKNIYLNQYLNL